MTPIEAAGPERATLGMTSRERFFSFNLCQLFTHCVGSNVRVERRAAVLWMLALYPTRVRSNALLGSAMACIG